MDPKQLSATIAAARAGSKQAYQELIGAFGPRLYGYFLRATGSHHEAEDLLAEVMLRVVRSLGEFDDRGRFEPWIFSIAANLVRDRIRRWKVHPQSVSLESSAKEQTPLLDALPDPANPPQSGLERDETQAAVRAALAELDERSRQMVLLRYFAEMSFKEIADVFNCPIGTVLARVHRAHKALRGILEGSEYEAD